METFPAFLELLVKDRLSRLNKGLRGGGEDRVLELSVETREDDTSLYLQLRAKGDQATLIIPRVRINEFGNTVVGDRHDRVLCPFMVVLNGQPQYVTYEQLVTILFSENIEELFREQGKRSFVDKILRGFLHGRGRVATNLCQRFLNQAVFNALPLSGTPMQDWVMNRRLMILDPVFGTLRPDDKLEYQRRKNELLHPWGSIGLSDGAAATKNYILQADLKKYTAYGMHHNPIRNLYSTGGMKGPEAARVISASAAKLQERGIIRGGWNWMTVFLDIPHVFEDLILVDKRHAGKEVTYRRSITVFGQEVVRLNDTILPKNPVGVNADGSTVTFDVACDHAKVVEIKDGTVPFDGAEEPVRIVVLEVTYTFKEGFKITNQHGNKGIVVLRDLGTVTISGVEHPIDVIVSAKSVQKRKNFGQVLEAMTTLINPGQTVVPDDLVVSEASVEAALVKAGLPKDGTFAAKTPRGEFQTLAGWVHWGVTKTPEEQLWEARDVWAEDQKGVRHRGNKVSPIELKALTTLFGPGSKTVREILSYQQGVEEVEELLLILDGMRGNYREELPVVGPEALLYIPTGMGTFHAEERLIGTIADEEMYPNGCYLQLPFTLQVRMPFDRFKEEIVEGFASENAYDDVFEGAIYELDRVLIPSGTLRMPWQHPSGKFGMPNITTYLNQVLEALDRFRLGEAKKELVAGTVFKYLHHVGKTLSLKSGKISTHLMSVRYPWSSKATASLKPELPMNHVEIHRDMARGLRVNDGDYVMVERFPCLGFMSTRIQRVVITDDPQCKYVIRVSNNSLVSMNLDFDGDVVYIMSFHTDGAKEELRKNFHNPHPRIQEVLARMNGKKVPTTRTMTLQEMEIRSFPVMSAEEHAELNATSLAVKLWTGPVIALCYNLMRIVEGGLPYTDREAHINIEVFLDKVGNSVFSQKHGTRSLREECVEAVCLADVDAMVALGFPSKESLQLCTLIREQAARLGIRTDEELAAHYQRYLEEGRSNIINLIVRKFHRSYFATRSNLHPIDLLEYLADNPCDLVSHLINESRLRSRAVYQPQTAVSV